MTQPGGYVASKLQHFLFYFYLPSQTSPNVEVWFSIKLVVKREFKH